MHLNEVIHQKSYEHIVRQVRRAPITIMPAIVGFLTLLRAPIVLQWLLLTLYPDLFSGVILWPLAVLFVSIFYLSVNLFFYTFFVDFYLDLLILTNDRLIAIKQHGMFARTILEVDLYQIQDATSNVDGTFATLFNFGNLIIETSGADPKTIAVNIQNPHALRREILDLSSVDKRYHSGVK